MSFSLTKEEASTIAGLCDDLDKAKDKINSIVIEYNEAVLDLRSPIEEAVTEYNNLLSQAREIQQGIVSKATESFSDRSEKWQESDTGQATQVWIDDWEGIDLGDVDYQWPDELEIDIPTHSTELSDLPAEAEG